MKCNYQNCKAHAMIGSEFCFVHNPETKEKHIEAASRGGLANKDINMSKLDSLVTTTPDGVVVLLQDTINRVRTVKDDGLMDLKTANCIGYLAGQLLKAIEVSEIESRLSLMEKIIYEEKSLTCKRR